MSVAIARKMDFHPGPYALLHALASPYKFYADSYPRVTQRVPGFYGALKRATPAKPIISGEKLAQIRYAQDPSLIRVFDVPKPDRKFFTDAPPVKPDVEKKKEAEQKGPTTGPAQKPEPGGNGGVNPKMYIAPERPDIMQGGFDFERAKKHADEYNYG